MRISVTAPSGAILKASGPALAMERLLDSFLDAHNPKGHGPEGAESHVEHAGSRYFERENDEQAVPVVGFAPNQRRTV